MTYLLDFIFGVVFGVLLNLPPKKVRYVILAALIISWFMSVAVLLDSGGNFPEWDWLSILFSAAGYFVGDGISWGIKHVLDCSW